MDNASYMVSTMGANTMGNIIVKKRVHRMYQECKDAGISQLVGRWQYIYSSDKGEIYLSKLINYFHDGIDLWEIFDLGSNNLINGVERFATKKGAERRIRELLK